MSKPYLPDPETDAIIQRQVAKGNFASPDEVIRAGVRMLEEQEAEIAELRRLIDEGDAAYARGEYRTYANADEFVADITSLGAAKSRRER